MTVIQTSELDISDLPKAEFAFPGPLRNLLVNAILAGTKTTTSSLLREYEVEGEPLPQVGARDVLINSLGQPVAILENTEVRVVSLGSVDLQHVIDEGEGDSSISSWRIKHEAFWSCPKMKEALRDNTFSVDDDTQVVLERFKVVSLID